MYVRRIRLRRKPPTNGVCFTRFLDLDNYVRTYHYLAMNPNVVLVTGALSGIGRATALAFARAGDRVVVSGRRDDAGEALVGELRTLGIGSEAEFIRADVSKDDEVRSLVDGVVTRFGRLDVAVNNAGTEGKLGPITELTAPNYTATFDTNVLGTLLSMKHELRVMQSLGAGSIINLSSTFGHRGGPNAALYVASKHAVEGLTKSAALEGAAYNVRVNAVAPGPIDTELLKRFTGSAERRAEFAAGVPLKRLGDVDEIADVIVFLASHGARYLTGQIIDVNGGKTAA
jgi:NAD(P)-dependent dehydrogenase (short-subunit alcohol dehydrogenase family)